MLIALWRRVWGLCPECNSDAPYKDVCEVCKHGTKDKIHWWDRYMYFRDNPSCDD